MTKKIAQSNGNIPNIAQRTVCVIVRAGLFGVNRKISTGAIEVDADKDAVRASKRLFESEERQEVIRLDSELKRWLYAHALPGSIFKEGVYVINLADLEKVDNRCIEHVRKRADLVEQFIAVYPQKIEDARKALRSLFNAGDYPSTATVRAAFTFDWHYVEFSVPGQIEGMNHEIFQRETEKARAEWRAWLQQAQSAVVQELDDLLTHSIDRLAGDDDGKPKVFRASMLDNLREFFDAFESRNEVLKIKELDPLIEKARALVAGIDPETLRKNTAVRSMVHDEFAKIKSQLDTIMVERPKRAISYEEVA